MESKFMQIRNDWINLDDIKWIVDNSENGFLQIYYSDTDASIPKVLRGDARKAFIHYMENHSYNLSVVESKSGKRIPVIVLIDICNAIFGNSYANARSIETTVPLTDDFIMAISSVIQHISDTEVRKYALNEIKGVSYGNDNK